VDNEAIQAKRLSGNKSGRGTFRRAKKNDAELFSGGTVEAFAGGMRGHLSAATSGHIFHKQMQKFGDTFGVAERHSQTTDYLAPERQPNDTAWLAG
jgi:hypothetical protein